MSLQAIQTAAAQGQLSQSDLVWREGMGDWVAAHAVPDLATLFPKRAGPPPIPVPPAQYYAPAPVVDDPGQNAGMRLLIPVGRSAWAIAAGYLGLFSLLIFPAPIAIAVSIIAIRDIRRHPDRHGMGRAIFGLVMGTLGSLAIVGGIVMAFMR
jgi:hypothetical protein